MMKVKYVLSHNICVNGKVVVTYGKIYDVVRYIPESNRVVIINDNGDHFHLTTSYFVEAVKENRDLVIDEILE